MLVERKHKEINKHKSDVHVTTWHQCDLCDFKSK